MYVTNVKQISYYFYLLIFHKKRNCVNLFGFKIDQQLKFDDYVNYDNSL